MNLHNETADLFIPDGESIERGLARTTHLGIGAHQDDLEVMAYHGIAECYGRPDRWFGGITCTNGAGSSRTGIYADLSDEDMVAVRRDEQRKAAIVGGYTFMAQLDYPSSAIKDPRGTALKDDLLALLSATKPGVVYTHNPADKHPSHIAVVIASIAALRELPDEDRPKHVYGCEVWRNLDWLPDEEKVALDVSERTNLATALVSLFDSQISGGKRYDLATLGRWQANATYLESHAVDAAGMLAYAMDLTPLVEGDSLDVVDYVLASIDRFRADVKAKLSAQLGRG